MSTAEVSEAEAVDLHRRRSDPRLPAYLVAGFGALFYGLVTSQPELAALGAPFLTLLVLGLADRRPAALSARVDLVSQRAMAGDVLKGTVTVRWDGEAEVDVMLDGWRGVEAIAPAPVIGWSLHGSGSERTLPFEVRATSWGVHDIGTLWVRVRRPGSFVIDEHRFTETPTVRVLPDALRIGRLLKPAEPRAVSGMHLARHRGQGTDFAELRPYQPGDRLRDLSWGTSARLGVPWVRVNHPERTGTVLLLLDTVLGQSTESKEALTRAAQATWAVASMHLRAQDRVGLLARGRTAAWLPPRGGRRARFMVMDELLAIGGAAEDETRRRYARSREQVPADALVVGVTSLRSQTFVPDILHYRRRGHTTVALIIDTSDHFGDAKNPIEATAARVWVAQREAERHLLERGGVPTALVSTTHGVGAAVLTLRRRIDTLRQSARSGAASR